MSESKENEDVIVGFSKPNDIDNDNEDNTGEGEVFTKVPKNEQFKESVLRLQDATAPQTGLATENLIMRSMWVLAYIGLFLVFCFQTNQLRAKYFDYPTKIEIQIITKSNLPFPAVTVCNNNPVRKSLLGRIRDQEDLILLDDYVMKSVRKLSESSFSETDFGEKTCSGSDFLCSDGEHCIPSPWICNGIDNCKDSSDEMLENCAELKKERKLANEAAKNSSQGICQDGYIQCPGLNFCAVPCDNNHECSSWNAYDESVQAGCNVTSCETNLTASSTEQLFTSPGFDSSYPKDLNCTWKITAPDDQIVQVTFKEVSIEGEMGDCSYDFLQLRNGPGPEIVSGVIKVDGKTRVCGIHVPKQSTYNSTGTIMTVNFRSDDSKSLKGFQIAYKAVTGSSRSRRQTDVTFDDVVSFERLSSISERSEKEVKEIVGRRKRSTDEDYDSSKNESTGDYEGSSSGDYAETDGGNPEAENSDYSSDYDSDYDDYDYYGVGGYDSGDMRPFSEYNMPATNQFYGIDDYYSLYKAAKLPDFADFRLAVVFHRSFIKLNGHQRKDFIIQCTFDGRECSENMFKAYQDPYYGNCFSFNSIRDRDLSQPEFIKKTTKTGQNYGLKISLFLDVDEYIGLFAPYAGAKALIHDAYSNGRVRAEGLSVPAGEATFLSVTQNTVKRVGGKYSDCAHSWPRFLKLNAQFKKQWPNYSREMCLELCLQNNLAEKCGCTDAFDKDFSLSEKINSAALEYCDMTKKKESQCKKDIYQKYIQGNITCVCPQACDTTKYSYEGSNSPWPTAAFSPYLASKLAKSSSKRVQEYMNTAFNDSDLSAQKLESEFRKNFARLEVFFEALNFHQITESPSYTGTDFLSDFGGNIGLWLGWSVLALFEVVQFFYECFRIMVN